MQYQSKQIEQLHQFLKTTHTSSEMKRALAMLALSKGKKRFDVADMFEVNVSTCKRQEDSEQRAVAKLSHLLVIQSSGRRVLLL